MKRGNFKLWSWLGSREIGHIMCACQYTLHWYIFITPKTKKFEPNMKEELCDSETIPSLKLKLQLVNGSQYLKLLNYMNNTGSRKLLQMKGDFKVLK